MRRYDPATHQHIVATFGRFPRLSDRAVARLTGTGPETVGRVRAINGIAAGQWQSARPPRDRKVLRRALAG